jgi:hypothetical protein
MLQFHLSFQKIGDFKPTGQTVKSYLHAREDEKYPDMAGLMEHILTWGQQY